MAVVGGIRFGGNRAAGGGAGGGDRCSKMGEMEPVVVAAVAEVATMAELEDASAGEKKDRG